MALQTGGFTWHFYSDTTIGWQFDLSSQVTVTALGFLDLDGNVVDSHPVGIWNATGTLLASATVQPTDPKTDGFLFHDIAPVVLPAGSGYVAGALPTPNDTWGNGAAYANYSTPVSFVQYLLGEGGTLHFPSSPGGYVGQNVYALSNFMFTSSTVPLPPAILLLGSGLVRLVGWKRCRKG
ncbi:DUF4082 domain-containing protein [Desulfobacca acetoxidans]